MAAEKKKTTKNGGGGEKEKKKKTAGSAAPKDAKEKTSAPKTPREVLVDSLSLLKKGVAEREVSYILRALRRTSWVRRKVDVGNVCRVAKLMGLAETENASLLFAALGALKEAQDSERAAADAMEEDGSGAAPSPAKETSSSKRAIAAKSATLLLPEVEMYFYVLVTPMLVRRGRCDEAAKLAAHILARAKDFDFRPTIGALLRRLYHNFSLAHEKLGTLSEIRGELIAAHRTACLRLDTGSQATLINLIIRNFLKCNMPDQAIKFSSKATFPDNAPNNELIRNLFYCGKLLAIQLDYTSAANKLIQAIRKAPANVGLGFRVAAHKLAVLVQLLTGEIPDRSWFSEKDFAVPLAPYFDLALAVKQGSIADFDAAREKHADAYKADGVFSLVFRLRHSVIKTGLRNINVSYSRISFSDIAERLAMSSAASAEFVCAKAIRDGVIDAVIDHEQSILISAERGDVYDTLEPQEAYHRRIQFCISVHNDAVKSMSYPANAHMPKNGGEKAPAQDAEEEITELLNDLMNGGDEDDDMY